MASADVCEAGMRAIGTNVLVRLLVRDDGRQATAAESFVERGAWISTLALAEASWVLATVYERSTDHIANTVEMLLNHKSLVLEDSDAVAAALDLLRSRPALGFSDCLLLELARKAGHLPLGTFDRKLGRAAGAHPI